MTPKGWTVDIFWGGGQESLGGEATNREQSRGNKKNRARAEELKREHEEAYRHASSTVELEDL